MRYLLLLLLVGCSQPSTTTVDKSQTGYTMPLRYTVAVRVVDDATLAAMCRLSSEIGCQVWDSPTEATIYIAAGYQHREHALEHEFDHLIYGPLHTKQSSTK